MFLQPEMIRYWGYDAEEHTVTTEDGYIVTLHRIPRGAGEKPEDRKNDTKQRKTPVLMYHCLLCSSAVFTFGPPERSLGYLLADAGTVN